MWRDTLSNNELEFLSENSLIEIIPSFNKPSLSLPIGTFGPFKPNKIVKVPLWFAIKLNKENKCKIIPPSIYSISQLKNILDSEKENKSSFFCLIPNFFEIINNLLNECPECFENSKKVSELIEDIASVRNEKINKIIENINENDLNVNLTNLNDKEIEKIRPLLNTIFKMKLDYYRPEFVNPNSNMLFVEGFENNIMDNNVNNEKKNNNNFDNTNGFGLNK